VDGDRPPVSPPRHPTRRWTGFLPAAIPLLFFGYLFAYPVTRILVLSLTEGNGFSEALGDPRIRSSIWFTVWQATASTVLTMLAALPLTAVLSHYRFPGRNLLKAAVAVPFVLPTVVVGSAFVALGFTGSVWAILAAHVFYNVAVVVRTVGGVWSRIDPSLVAAARTLGATRLRAFREVTAPLLAPAIAAASSIVFLFTFTSFGVVLIIGGLAQRTIEVEIYQQAVTFLNLPVAGALGLAQLVGVAAIMTAYSRFQERHSRRFRLVDEAQALRPVTGRSRVLVPAVIAITYGLLFTPLVVLFRRSFSGDAAGWRFLIDPGRLAIRPLDAVGNSLLFAVLTAIIATTVGVMAATVVARSTRGVGNWFDVVLMLPLGTSAVTIGFGFLVALDRPVDIRTSVLLIPLAHALVAVPFVVRTSVPILRSIRPRLREAAAVLGASPVRVWREVDLPIVARAVAVGAGFAAAISLGEFGATAFIARPDTITIPTLIFRLLGRPGAVTYSGAMALAVILMVITTAVILAIDRARGGEVGRF
jgi:thiamine transport system permease protein